MSNSGKSPAPASGAPRPGMKKTPASTASGAYGFTLLELVVVLFVLTVIMAVVLPTFTSSDNRLRTEARRMASVMRYLNETSSARKQTLGLQFDLKEGTVAWDEGGGIKKETLTSLRAVGLQSTGMVSEGELTVFFRPVGLREQIKVYLELDGAERTVKFNPISGRVKIIEGNPNETDKQNK